MRIRGEEGRAKAIAAGRISKIFGLNGELVISLYDAFPYENPKGESVYVEIDGIWTPFFFASFRRRGQSKAVAVFDDMDTEYRASELVGKEFFVFAAPEEAEADGDELYLEDLAGYTVVIRGQEARGEITGFIDSEFNPLFEVDWNGTELLIPAADDFIVEVDEKRRTLLLELPEGLLEL